MKQSNVSQSNLNQGNLSQSHAQSYPPPSSYGIREWRLRPGLPVLKCGADTVQLGLDRRWAMRLSDLSPKEIRWLQNSAQKHLQLRRSAVTNGITEARAVEICTTLARSGLLVPNPRNTKTAQKLLNTNSSKLAAGGATDLPALSALRQDGQGQTTLNRRATSRVAITCSGRLGAQVAVLLAAAGVGNLQLPDRAAITLHDIGPYLAAEVGRSRAAGLRRRFTELGLNPDLKLTGTPDWTISIDTGTQSAVYFSTLHQLAVPYLAVAVGEAEVEVGPLVVPDRSACTHCLQLWRAASDEHWAGLVAELATMPQRPVETTLATASAALIAAQALTFIDGGRPNLVNGIATIALPEVSVETVPLYPNPNCGCVTVPPPVPA
jgi:bacteriocin biosynthesis cyclodehydratase domain-containing protein